jgi:hypothetical protein
MGSTKYSAKVLTYDSIKEAGFIDGPFANTRMAVHKFGFNPEVSTVYEYITFQGGAYPWPTGSSPLRVQSGGNINDNVTGSGAQRVKVFGLDSNFDIISVTMVLSGSSASSFTTGSFQRVHRAFVEEVGTYTGANTGDIQIEDNGGNILADIGAGLGQTQMGLYTVPAGMTGYIVDFTISSEAGKPISVQGFQRQNADKINGNATAKRIFYQDVLEGAQTVRYDIPVSFPEKTDIWYQAKTSSGTSTVQVTFEILLISSSE